MNPRYNEMNSRENGNNRNQMIILCSAPIWTVIVSFRTKWLNQIIIFIQYQHEGNNH